MSNPYVKIDHPTGASMKYSEKLFMFLAERKKQNNATRFRTGEWLSTLADSELRDLIELGDSQSSGEPAPGKHPHACDDFLQVSLLALAAEKNTATVEITAEMTDCLSVCVSLEHLSREGFVELNGTISVDPDAKPPRVTVTAKGLAAGEALKRLN